MCGKYGQVKGKLTLNWRRTNTKTSINCYRYAEVHTKDGLKYESESLKSMLAALDQHLKEHDYKYLIKGHREFYQSKLVLEGKVKHLRQQGKGKRLKGRYVFSWGGGGGLGNFGIFFFPKKCWPSLGF